MKRLSFITIILLLSSIPVFALTVDELSKKYQDPAQLSDWMYKNISYDTDDKKYKREYVQTPEETIKTKSGDCADMAILAYAVLTKQGHDSRVVGITANGNTWGNVRGHSICVFYYKDNWCYFDYTSFNETDAKDLFEICQRVSADLRSIYIYADPLGQCTKNIEKMFMEK
jgi:transglutaminase-like putative cysteine protease